MPMAATKDESTYNTVEYIERRLKVEMRAESVHLEQHFKDEQTQKHKLRID